VQFQIDGQGRLEDLEVQFDVLVDAPELVHAFLQAGRDGRIPRLDDVPGVCLRSGLTDKQHVVDNVVDEVQVALYVVAINVDLGGFPEEPLELGKSHYRRDSSSC
jgi:hypothetical protein